MKEKLEKLLAQLGANPEPDHSVDQLARYAMVMFNGRNPKSAIRNQDHPGGKVILLSTVGTEVTRIEIEDRDSFPEAVYELISDLLGKLEK